MALMAKDHAFLQGTIGPALVISANEQRFQRAQHLLRSLRLFSSVLRIPGVFLENDDPEACQQVQGCTRGSPLRRKLINGHRVAMRMAWRRIVRLNKSAAVFEDDIALSQNASALAISRFISACEGTSCDVAYLGEDEYHRWWTNHAQWISVNGARLLLRYAGSYCLTRYGLDMRFKVMCRKGNEVLRRLARQNGSTETPSTGAPHAESPIRALQRDGQAVLACMHAPYDIRTRVASWDRVFNGFFGQDRVAVQPFIHVEVSAAEGSRVHHSNSSQASIENDRRARVWRSKHEKPPHANPSTDPLGVDVAC